jgi:hypothetical protein
MERRIEELLPFAANGSLSPEEQAEIDAAAAADPQVAAELKSLRAIGDAMRTTETPASPGALGWARLQRELRKSAPSRTRALRADVWRWVAIAACLVVVAQTLALTALLSRRDDVLVAAGDSGAAQGAFIAQIVFKPDAREQDIRALLLDVKGALVDGPSALGVYKASFRSEEEARAAVEKLRARPEIVEFAEVE